jgi:GT2 family glycosyltransferase/SAM-dependent methyltransferase
MPEGRSAGWGRSYELDKHLRIYRRRDGEAEADATESGEVEDRLFRIVDGARDIRDGSGELASYISDWPSLYHLSPRRSNLLRPLAEGLGGTVLEVGASCGALTRFLGENGAQVVALEPDSRKARVAAARCRDLPGVSVVCDHLHRFPSGEGFDAVLLIGVLEDVHGLSDVPDPVQRMLEEARDRLRPGGRLVVAIENQLGLKYFAGYPEFHSGQRMYGINDFHDGRAGIASGRLETLNRLSAAGFGAVDLFVPLPDYKVPVTVIAPSGLSDERWTPVVSSLAASSAGADPRAPKRQLFSLGQAWKVVVRNGLLPDLANSFLFVARRDGKKAGAAGPSSLAFHYSSERKEPYRTVTEIVSDGAVAVVRRRPLRADAPGPAAPSLLRQRYVEEAVVAGTLVSEDLARVTRRPGWTLAETIPPLRVWTQAVAQAVGMAELAIDTMVPGEVLDATPSNLIRGDGGAAHFIDLEWEVPGGLEFGWLLFRGLFHAFSGLLPTAEPGVLPSRNLVEFVGHVGVALGFRWTDQDIGRSCVREAALQATVFHGQASLIETAIRQREILSEPDLSSVLASEEREAALLASLREAGDREGEFLRMLETLGGELSVSVSARVSAEGRVEELGSNLAAARGELSAARAESDEKGLRLSRVSASLEQTKRTLRWLDRKKTEIEEALATRGEELRLATAEVRRSRREAAVASAEIETLRSRLESLEETLQEQLREVDALRRSAIQMSADMDIRALERTRESIRENARLALRLEEATNDLEAMRRSRSWRATEPIRRWARMATSIRSGFRSPVSSVPLPLSALLARLQPAALGGEELAIEASGLFDEAYYATRHSGKSRWGLAPLRHFVWIGARQGFDPHPLFDVGWYRNASSWGAGAEPNPVLHYLRTPQADRQSPCPLFDVSYYLRWNPDVARGDVEPILHYLTFGAREGRNPHPLFDTRFYLDENPDVAASGANPLVHFILTGAAQGRSPHPLFDPAFYRERNADVAAGDANPLVHFVTCGAREGRPPHPLFDTAFYLESNPDVRASGVNPLVHFLEEGWREGRQPSPTSRWADSLALHLEDLVLDGEALVGLLRSGQPFERPDPPTELGALAAGDSQPSPRTEEFVGLPPEDEDARLLFDGAYYLETYPDIEMSGVDPFGHFMTNGWKERRDPHPLFSTAYYLESNGDVAAAGENPLLHFLRRGGAAGRSPHPFFDASFYLETYPEVRESGVNPLLDYLGPGVEEDRQPNPWFDGAAYRRIHLEGGPENPLVHYALVGRSAGLPTHAGLSSPEAWHHDYTTMKALIGQDRRDRIAAFRPTPPGILALRDEEVEHAGESLSFRVYDEPVVSIVIPVYDQVRLTVECLSSIRAAGDDVPFEIIVSDDGSTDATAELLPRVKGLHLVRNEENLGFLRNCNKAAKLARGAFVLFLNNDVQVTPGWLKHLLAVFEERSDVGAVGPKVLFPNGRLQEAGARILPDGSTRFIGVQEDPAQPRFSGARRVDYCSGVCLLLRRKTFEDLGGFDEALAPAYYEDVDLCLRLQDAGLSVYCSSEAVVIHHLSETTRFLPDEYKTKSISSNRQSVLSRHWDRIQQLNEVKLVAFYLPQFHPIPENDRWWGKGFTEWQNVVRGRPNFEGHDQPRLPADLGYYDLRVEETIEDQRTLASRYGIGAFCYYYYWFAGKRLLEEPIERLLKTKTRKMPFCLAWANENWTRTWDGGASDILIGQEHSPDDDINVIHDLIRYFRDPDYLRIDGRPVLLLYRYDLLPDVRSTLGIWRQECVRAGVGDPYVVACEACDLAWSTTDPRLYGFDASTEFPPHGVGTQIDPPGRPLNPRFSGRVYDYRAASLKYAARAAPAHKRFRCVFPGWDNTARRPDSGDIFAFSSPGTYRAWLETVAEETREQFQGEERLVFVNAWNEWAEGCYLEPDVSTGHGYLEATQAALDPRKPGPW